MHCGMSPHTYHFDKVHVAVPDIASMTDKKTKAPTTERNQIEVFSAAQL